MAAAAPPAPPVPPPEEKPSLPPSASVAPPAVPASGPTSAGMEAYAQLLAVTSEISESNLHKNLRLGMRTLLGHLASGDQKEQHTAAGVLLKVVSARTSEGTATDVPRIIINESSKMSGGSPPYCLPTVFNMIFNSKDEPLVRCLLQALSTLATCVSETELPWGVGVRSNFEKAILEWMRENKTVVEQGLRQWEDRKDVAGMRIRNELQALNSCVTAPKLLQHLKGSWDEADIDASEPADHRQRNACYAICCCFLTCCGKCGKLLCKGACCALGAVAVITNSG